MGKIYVVGIGPGEEDMMTIQAVETLERSETIVGYTTYCELLGERFRNKEIISTPMRQEIERCQLAFDIANQGKTVSMICSGDAGVYGMASPILEMSENYPDVEVEIIPGITAALSGAAVLGAPLSHDFCVISLSDLLTPWDVIEKRLRAAAIADFCIAIYNPSSMKRADYLSKACTLLMEEKSPETICGYVMNIGREGEFSEICRLSELKDKSLNMFTTVFVGNNQTKVIEGRMVTPRGYIWEK